MQLCCQSFGYLSRELYEYRNTQRQIKKKYLKFRKS